MTTNADSERTRIQEDCWTRAIYSFGTAALFEKRARHYQRLVRIPAFLGIAAPVFVGGMVLSFGTEAPSLPRIIWAAALIGIVQLVISVWALVARWDASLAAALESAAENHRLAGQFQKLAKNPSDNMRLHFDILDATYQARSDADVRLVVSPSEKRFGLRCALQRFQRKCVGCQVIPNPDNPSQCVVCGK